MVLKLRIVEKRDSKFYIQCVAKEIHSGEFWRDSFHGPFDTFLDAEKALNEWIEPMRSEIGILMVHKEITV